MRTIIQKEKLTEIMNRLRPLYNWLARVRFGFFTGAATMYLAFSVFIIRADYAGLSYEDNLLSVIDTGAYFLFWAFLVRFLGEVFRFFMLRRSCTVDGVPE